MKQSTYTTAVNIIVLTILLNIATYLVILPLNGCGVLNFATMECETWEDNNITDYGRFLEEEKR